MTGSKRRYAAITSGGRRRRQPSSSLPPDGPLLSKAAREQEEYQQVLGVTLNLIASLGQLPGLLQISARPLCVRSSKSLAFAKSFLQPRYQPARFEHTTCRSSGSCCGVPTGNCHRASGSSKLPTWTLPISWRSWHTSVVRCQNLLHRVWLGGSNS